MKRFLLVFLMMFMLASCNTREGNEPIKNPYPTLPIGATSIPMDSHGDGDNYEAIGTEPFWNAEITATGVVFSRSGETGTMVLKYETRQEERDGNIVIRDAKGEFFITLKKESCTDGMSEKRYYFIANIALGAENLKGCANKN